MMDSPERSAAARLAAEMGTLYDRSKFRTYESLAKKLACSRTTATAILKGKRLPDREFVCGLVDVCVDGAAERQQYQARLSALWEAAKSEKREIGQLPGQQPGGPLLEVSGFEKEMIPVTWYANNSEFYSAATEYAKAARERIRVTYVRQTPPSLVTSPEASEYFDAVLNFAREPGAQEVTRIIGAPVAASGKLTEAMIGWLEAHHEETDHIHNYEARVVRWTSGGDGLNMALFDHDTSFLAVSGQGGRQHLSGFSVTSGRFIEYLASYFDQLWTTLEPLENFLNEYHEAYSR